MCGSKDLVKGVSWDPTFACFSSQSWPLQKPRRAVPKWHLRITARKDKVSSETGNRQCSDVSTHYKWAVLLGNWETRRNAPHSKIFQDLLRKSKSCLSVSPSETSHQFAQRAWPEGEESFYKAQLGLSYTSVNPKPFHRPQGWFRLVKPRLELVIIFIYFLFLFCDFWRLTFYYVIYHITTSRLSAKRVVWKSPDVRLCLAQLFVCSWELQMSVCRDPKAETVTERKKIAVFFYFLWSEEENQQENCLKSSWQDSLESAFVRVASDPS